MNKVRKKQAQATKGEISFGRKFNKRQQSQKKPERKVFAPKRKKNENKEVFTNRVGKNNS